MKVKRVIELLEKTYNLDDELMIDWVDQEQNTGTLYCRCYLTDRVQDIVNEAKKDLEEEV